MKSVRDRGFKRLLSLIVCLTIQSHRYIARCENKLNGFNMKWRDFLQWLIPLTSSIVQSVRYSLSFLIVNNYCKYNCGLLVTYCKQVSYRRS